MDSSAALGAVSPKGDPPGSVRILDARTLLLADRPGNRRADSLRNILANPHVALLFLIPGVDETLRVNGTAEVVQDAGLRALLSVDDRVPDVALLIHVEEAFLHCGRSVLRARLWDPATRVPRDTVPSLAAMIEDQTRPDDRSAADHAACIAAAEEQVRQAYGRLY